MGEGDPSLELRLFIITQILLVLIWLAILTRSVLHLLVNTVGVSFSGWGVLTRVSFSDPSNMW